MPPKINGCSMADLVKQEVHKEVEAQLTEMHNLLLGALARITCLEKEISECKVDSSAPRLPPTATSSSSSQLCRHWLKRRCTWKEKCRFSHGSDADSESSYSAAINAKDLEEVEMLTKVAKVKLTPSSSSREVKLPSSEIVGCLIKSNLPPRHQSVSGALQSTTAGATLMHETGANIVTSLLDEMLNSVVARVSPITKAPIKLASPQVGPLAPMSKEELWQESMVEAVDTIEAKFMAKYNPIEHDGFTHSAEVAVPVINFAKVKPHLHKNLPKPAQLPVQSCSPLPDFYRRCTICADAHSKGGWAESHGLKRCAPPFEQLSPFGSLPGFVTSLGVVAVPADPIGGYVYAGGWEADTRWQLHAEAVYI